MSEEKVVLYLTRRRGGKDPDGYNQCRVWTVSVGADGNLREYTARARFGDIGKGFHFSRSVVHKSDDPKALGNEIITGRRLFKGYEIYPQPFLLNPKTLEARPDKDASALTGIEGESLLRDPLFHPDPKVTGSPDWFF